MNSFAEDGRMWRIALDFVVLTILCELVILGFERMTGIPDATGAVVRQR